MWLIEATTFELRQFFGSKIPKYSILSHTWEDEEITFQELAQPCDQIFSKKGFAKIEQTCVLAHRDGLKYAWIDTCCIDKTSSAELTESINSMFQWYKNATKCYVYLSDLLAGVPPQVGLANCRWFTRGWTLQELIAPIEVQFYDQNWQYIGMKEDFPDTLASITRINSKLLMGYEKLAKYSVATRMSWAAHRKTQRIEDLAYCLLGIFDIAMPLIYGEGENAFRRLQEKIIQRSNDLTIFAWDGEEVQDGPFGLFAISPAAFSKSDSFDPCDKRWSDPVFSLTNKGLRFDNFKLSWKMLAKFHDNEYETTRYSITIGLRGKHNGKRDFHMPLRKVGPELFVRDGNLVHDPTPVKDSGIQVSRSRFYLLTEIPDSYSSLEHENRYNSIYFPRDDRIKILNVLPESHWNETCSMFFAPLQDYTLVLAISCLVTLGTSRVEVIVCIEYSTDNPRCRIFDAEEYNGRRLRSWLFRYGVLGHDVTWNDVRGEEPAILDFTDQTAIYANGMMNHISASLGRVDVGSVSGGNIYSLRFQIEATDKKGETPLLPSLND